MNVTECLICGSAGQNLIYKIDNISIIECSACGFKYSSPIPTGEEIIKNYSEEYFEREYDTFADEELVAHDVGSKMYARIEKYVAPGKVLDIGCGVGNYIFSGQKRGWTCYGIDVSPVAAKITREKTGAEVFVGFIEDAGYENGFFDSIVMVHSLEHQVNPRVTLKEVFRALRPGGVLFISVPNIESVEAKRGGTEWRGLQPGFHYYHFSKQSLSQLVSSAGFDIIEIESPFSAVSGKNVDNLLGKGAGSAVRTVAKKLIGPAIKYAKNKASEKHEGEVITMAALKPSPGK